VNKYVHGPFHVRITMQIRDILHSAIAWFIDLHTVNTHLRLSILFLFIDSYEKSFSQTNPSQLRRLEQIDPAEIQIAGIVTLFTSFRC
jgi:hypothetical protein